MSTCFTVWHTCCQLLRSVLVAHHTRCIDIQSCVCMSDSLAISAGSQTAQQSILHGNLVQISMPFSALELPNQHAEVQVIKPELLKEGFQLVQQQKLEVTDDVSIIEAMGRPVKITKGSYTNIKVMPLHCNMQCWVGLLVVLHQMLARQKRNV